MQVQTDILLDGTIYTHAYFVFFPFVHVVRKRESTKEERQRCVPFTSLWWWQDNPNSVTKVMLLKSNNHRTMKN